MTMKIAHRIAQKGPCVCAVERIVVRPSHGRGKRDCVQQRALRNVLEGLASEVVF